MSSVNPYESPRYAPPAPAGAREPPPGKWFEPPLVLSYTGTLDDLVELNMTVQAAQGSWRRVLRWILIFGGMYAVCTLLGGQLQLMLAGFGIFGVEPWLVGGAIAGGLIAFDVAFAALLGRWWLTLTLPGTYGDSEIRRRSGPIRLMIDDEAITEELPLSLARFDWRLIERIEPQPEHCFLFISSLRAFVVPRRAFDADADYERFCRLAQARLAALAGQLL